MTTFDLNTIKDEPKEQTSDFFKFPVGETKIRVMTDLVQVKQVFKGEYPKGTLVGFVEEGQTLAEDEKVRVSGWAWCWVEGEGLKIITFPYSLITKLAKLKQTDDYAWEDMPMPYEITVGNTGSGGDRYSITPARSNTDVPKDVLEELGEKTPIEDIVQKIKDKKNNQEVDKKFEDDYPESKGEDIPF